MERTHIEDGRRPTSKESTWRNPWRGEKPRSTDEKMERRTGIEEEEEEGLILNLNKQGI